MRIDRDAMRRAADRGMLSATDLADHLARRGVPFREAHSVVGRIVQEALAAKRGLGELTLEDLHRHHRSFDASALEELDIRRSLASRTSPGGTAPARVREALVKARERLGR
jgi:argininosuccinate lyase